MDHVVIMKKSWGLLPKIISGAKTIESRWYQTKVSPWGKVNPGDSVYFKNSGEPVTVCASVKKVKQFENLNPEKIGEILQRYGEQNGISCEQKSYYLHLFEAKKYCILVFLRKVTKIKSFEINKKGFGTMAAWITVDDIERIRI